MSVVAWFELWVGVAAEEDVAAVQAAFEEAGKDPQDQDAGGDEARAFFDSEYQMIGYGVPVYQHFENAPEPFDVDELAKNVAEAKKKAAAALKELGLDPPIALWANSHTG